MQNDRSCRLLQKMTVGWYRDTTNHDTEIGLFDKDQFCSISVDRRRAYMRSYNSLTTPRDARGWEWIDNAAKMVSGKRDQRIVRLLVRRTTLRGFCFQEFFFFFHSATNELFFRFNLSKKRKDLSFFNDNLRRFITNNTKDSRIFFKYKKIFNWNCVEKWSYAL